MLHFFNLARPFRVHTRVKQGHDHEQADGKDDRNYNKKVTHFVAFYAAGSQTSYRSAIIIYSNFP